jgi:hypothetical protein
MLDDMAVLRAAVEAYRAAATAAGVPQPDDSDRSDELPLDVLCRTFDVDHVAEQLLWLRSQSWLYEAALPEGAYMQPWAIGDDLLDALSFAVATPFHWRHQVPLFFCDHLVFTFVLTGDREGEVWRYHIDPDNWVPVRAAPSLAAMFSEWTKGFAANVYEWRPSNSWLRLDYEGADAVDMLLARDLDPLAFPTYIFGYLHGDLIPARQRECGVDVDRAEEFEAHEEVLDGIDAARASLRL